MDTQKKRNLQRDGTRLGVPFEERREEFLHVEVVGCIVINWAQEEKCSFL